MSIVYVESVNSEYHIEKIDFWVNLVTYFLEWKKSEKRGSEPVRRVGEGTLLCFFVMPFNIRTLWYIE